MDRAEFLNIRHYLEKTQNEMARLLGCSLKAIQSFEQGRRNIPMHIERQVLFLLHLKKSPDTRYKPCWALIHCDADTRQHCPAWEFQAGHMCWFINGTICHGIRQEDWNKKMELCRQCSVFQTTMPLIIKHNCDDNPKPIKL